MSAIEQSPYHGITLYSHPNDHYSHSVRLVLAEKNIQYRLILVDEHQDDVAMLNPYGTLPTLVDPYVKLYKAAIINEYLDERYRQKQLYADTPAERAQQRQLLWRIEQDWFKLADILLRHADSLDVAAQQQARRELSDTLVSISPLFQRYPYFMSEQWSILDCALAPLLLRLGDMCIRLSHQQCQGLLRYCQRVFQRETFQQSLTLYEQTRYTDLLRHFKV